MAENQFYDGTKLLSLMDINGEKPEIYICTSNRSAGKTTYFSRYLVNRFKKHEEKFMLVYRFNYELDNIADKFFKDIHGLFFPEDTFTSEKMAKGIFHMLYLNGEHCGYAIALNNADQIKKYSHLFSDTCRMLMDEFQSESDHYCPNEVTKFISIHMSVARGQGCMSRYVPVIMLGNYVKLLNPYYTHMGISEKLNIETKFLRGNGYVVEQGFNDTASKMISESGFNRAFEGNKYVTYATQRVYLNDNLSFVEKPQGKSRYLCTLKYEGELYAVRSYDESGVVYCDTKADKDFRNKICVTTDDHMINFVMLKRNDVMIVYLRELFEKGCFRFKNQKCKEVILKTLAYY